jgi:hypothetical protein
MYMIVAISEVVLNHNCIKCEVLFIIIIIYLFLNNDLQKLTKQKQKIYILKYKKQGENVIWREMLGHSSV